MDGVFCHCKLCFEFLYVELIGEWFITVDHSCCENLEYKDFRNSPFLCEVTLKKNRRIGDKLCGTACEQDPFSEGLEVVKSITGSFQNFDPVVVALTDTVMPDDY